MSKEATCTVSDEHTQKKLFFSVSLLNISFSKSFEISLPNDSGGRKKIAY